MTDATSDTTSLPPVPEDWERALAIVAHPDDMEYGAAAAVARWTAQGKDVRYLLVTQGEAGIDSMNPVTSIAARSDEQRASCAAVGVKDLSYLSHPDGLVQNTLDLRQDLAAAIRHHQPEVIISINFREFWGDHSWNHHDHQAVGRGILDAARDAANRWIFPQLGPHWTGLRFAIFGGSTEPTHATDVTDSIDKGIASLRCHRIYLENLGANAPDPDEMLRSMARFMGPALGVEYAVGFELVQL